MRGSMRRRTDSSSTPRLARSNSPARTRGGATKEDFVVAAVEVEMMVAAGESFVSEAGAVGAPVSIAVPAVQGARAGQVGPAAPAQAVQGAHRVLQSLR